MITLLKKNNGIHTVINLHKQNDNTVKDVTPLPDQDQIRMNIARAPCHFKIDLSDVYKQVHIMSKDIGKMAFVTIYDTMVSLIMQQGDCNALFTPQYIMVYEFRDHIGCFIYVYLDNIFIFSYFIEDDEHHLGIIFNILWTAQLYLKAEKCNLYSTWVDYLSHIIDHNGLYSDADKMACLRD